MKNKKIIFVLIFFLLILAIFTTKSNATLELNNLNFDAKINSDGSMNVTEKWDIYISDTNTLYKTFEIDKTKYSEITDVEVKETTNFVNKQFTKINTEMYHVTENCYYGLVNSSNKFEIAWGVGMDDSSGTRLYEISYKVNDVISKYNDYSELYWQFVGNNFEIDSKKITGTITLPQKAEVMSDVKVWGHTKYLNGEIYVTDYDKVTFDVNQYYNSNFVEVRILMPTNMITYATRNYDKDILDKVIAEETIWADEANARREQLEKMKQCVDIGAIFIGIIVLLIAYKNYKKLKNMDSKYKVQKLDYFRDLPHEDATPAEAIFLTTEGVTSDFISSFSANILDLTLKKYLSLEVKEEKYKGNKIVEITILNEDTSNLKEDQKLVFEFIKKVSQGEKKFDTKQLSKYIEKHITIVDTYNSKFNKIIRKRLEQEGKYSEENYKKSQKYSVLAVFSIFMGIFGVIGIESILEGNSFIGAGVFAIAMLINIIILFKMYKKVNVFSQKGLEEKEQWNGLKKYMKDFSLLHEKDIPSLVVWEKFLVFATVFGISKEVIKQLKLVYPEFNDTNFVSTYAYINIMNSVDLGKTINSTVFSSVSSSGSGAGGGFSGGGGFGGGRRWRRWTLKDKKNGKSIFLFAFYDII